MSKFGFDRIHINSHHLLDMSGDQVIRQQFITLEDTFSFHCKACGKCCKNRDPYIALTAYDVYRLAGFFGRTPDGLVSQYCEVDVQSYAPFLSPYLLMRAGTCPFLRNKKCFVHSVKPGVCRCYPLARTFWHDDLGAYFNVGSTSCHHEPREIKVRDWVGDFATEEAEQIGQAWNNALVCILYSMMNDETFTKANTERQKNICKIMFFLLYLAYDAGQPFYPQLEKNVANLREVMAETYGFNIISVPDFRKMLVDEGSPLCPPNSTRRNADV